ncbi:MAG: hypothetical protein ACSHW0_10630 [Thalassotalea sp.]
MNKYIDLIGSNLTLLRHVLLLSGIVMLSGCAMSPEEIAQKKAINSFGDCLLNQASDFRDNNSKEEVYTLFNIAYNNCSSELEDFKKKVRINLENKILKKSNRENLPRWAHKEIDKAMVKFENTFKNTNFNSFKSIYQKS